MATSPFPEISESDLNTVAEECGLGATAVANVIQALLRRPPVFVKLAGRFGEVKVGRAKEGVVEVDSETEEKIVDDRTRIVQIGGELYEATRIKEKK